MKPVKFEGAAYQEFFEWALKEKKIFVRINALIKDIDRNFYTGIGKPEPLKHNYKGYWSRRITDEHRLIYKIEGDSIIISSLKGHYRDK